MRRCAMGRFWAVGGLTPVAAGYSWLLGSKRKPGQLQQHKGAHHLQRGPIHSTTPSPSPSPLERACSPQPPDPPVRRGRAVHLERVARQADDVRGGGHRGLRALPCCIAHVAAAACGGGMAGPTPAPCAWPTCAAACPRPRCCSSTGPATCSRPLRLHPRGGGGGRDQRLHGPVTRSAAHGPAAPPLRRPRRSSCSCSPSRACTCRSACSPLWAPCQAAQVGHAGLQRSPAPGLQEAKRSSMWRDELVRREAGLGLNQACMP